MKVCVVGSGGREHALVIKLAGAAREVIMSPYSGAVSWAVKNLDQHPKNVTTTAAKPEDIDADLFVIGPEAPLADGLADRLRSQGKLVLGPSLQGAKLESSKVYMKQLLSKYKIPTANFQIFEDIDSALKFIAQNKPPFVIKTDGLAAGKGVLVADSLEKARQDIVAKLSGAAFGESGKKIIIEEALNGSEISIMALYDNRSLSLFSYAKDYKRAFDNDKGPNTGGMGSISPVPGREKDVDKAIESCIEPLAFALKKEEIDYRGFLYAGLMLTEDGPFALEYNVRLGDPEAQAILSRTDDDLVEIFSNCANGSLKRDVLFKNNFACSVVCVSENYPGQVTTGKVITGIESIYGKQDLDIYFSAIDVNESGQLITSGGRVISVVASGQELSAARKKAYQNLEALNFEGIRFRHDIGAEFSS